MILLLANIPFSFLFAWVIWLLWDHVWFAHQISYWQAYLLDWVLTFCIVGFKPMRFILPAFLWIGLLLWGLGVVGLINLPIIK